MMVTEHSRLSLSLCERIETRQANVCVIGLGYVGLPLAVALSQAGFSTRGLDVDEEKVSRLRAGESYVIDVEDEALAEAVHSGRFRPECDSGAALAGADVVIITVPTPYTSTKQPDLRYVRAAAEAIRPHLRTGMLVVLESTTYPGTTQEVVQPRLEASGLRCGEDFLLAYSPERIEPGNKRFGLRNTPKIVGGTTPQSSDAAIALYSSVIATVVPVSTPRVAEMAKLLENTFRHVNIALVNEMAILCHEMGINIWEVIDAAATKPFGFMPFYPGPGVGGHCIPIDPYYFAWKVQEFKGCARFIELAGQVNDQMPQVVVRRVQDALNDQQKSLSGARVMVVGVAYKRDIDDIRESPSLHVIEHLVRKGAALTYHDPFVPTLETKVGAFESVPLEPALLQASDVVIIVTDHTDVDYETIVRCSALIVDTRNVLRRYHDCQIIRL